MWQCTCNITLRCVRITTFTVEKQYVFLILNVCLQPYLSRMESARTVLLSVVCPAVLYISQIISYTSQFRKNVVDNNMCVMVLSKMFLCNISQSKKKLTSVVINIYCSSSKVPVILVSLKENLNFLERLSKNSNIKFHTNLSSRSPPNFELSRKIFKNTQISNFIKIRPVGVQLFHAEERTDRYDKANSRFWKFCE